MRGPLYEEGFELFECPVCRSKVKYRYDFDPKGNFVHWGECDFSMCHTHQELHYPEEVPAEPISLLVVKDKEKSTDRIVTAEEKIEFFHQVIKNDKHDFSNMSRDDLIFYIVCLDHFLGVKKEFDATLYLKMRFGVGK